MRDLGAHRRKQVWAPVLILESRAGRVLRTRLQQLRNCRAIRIDVVNLSLGIPAVWLRSCRTVIRSVYESMIERCWGRQITQLGVDTRLQTFPQRRSNRVAITLLVTERTSA
jgi:hypothetical protein